MESTGFSFSVFSVYNIDMQIKINKKMYEASPGETLLAVCRREGIVIPALCSHEDLPHEAACRLCLVEVNKTDKLVTACTFLVCADLEVVTEGEKIQKARRINLELLWADHAGKCASCRKNQRCELQDLATQEKIENFHFVPRREELTSREELSLLRDNWSRVEVDEKNKAIAHTTELCVECRRCINVCPTREFGFNHRAGDVVVGTPYGQTLDCIFCGQCVRHCPTGALTDKSDLEKISTQLDDLKKLSVAVLDPTLFASAENEFRQKQTFLQFLGVLRALGFEKIFSSSLGVRRWRERTKEVVGKMDPTGPKLGAYCPSLLRYVHKYYPEIKEALVDVPIPEELLAQEIKKGYAQKEKINVSSILVFALSPCTAKKTLTGANLDYVLGMRELGWLARKKKLDLSKIQEGRFDDFLGEKGTEEYSSRELENVAQGKAEIDRILKKIRRGEEKGFWNLLVCPGGCENGGGQTLKKV